MIWDGREVGYKNPKSVSDTSCAEISSSVDPITSQSQCGRLEFPALEHGLYVLENG